MMKENDSDQSLTLGWGTYNSIQLDLLLSDSIALQFSDVGNIRHFSNFKADAKTLFPAEQFRGKRSLKNHAKGCPNSGA